MCLLDELFPRSMKGQRGLVRLRPKPMTVSNRKLQTEQQPGLPARMLQLRMMLQKMVLKSKLLQLPGLDTICMANSSARHVEGYCAAVAPDLSL